MTGCGSQEGQALLGEKEDAFHVGVHHLVPAVFREFIQRCTPGRTCVVNQNIKLLFLFGHCLGKRCAAFDGGKVCRNGDAFATELFGQASDG